MAKFIVIHPDLDIFGGGERVCHHIVKTLVSHNQTVELLSFDFDRNRYEAIMGEKFPDNLIVHTLGKRKEVKPPFSVYKMRRNIIKLAEKIKNGVDYDYTFSTQSFTAFEAALSNRAKKNIAYVHFPEIHYSYYNFGLRKKIYLWPYKRWLENDIGNIDLVFCNSNYTKGMIEKYWSKFRVDKPVVVYPPVDLDPFWCDKPLKARSKRIVYVGRFAPQKRHEIMKKLALESPQFEFISVGALRDIEEKWFEDFSKNLPGNYILKPNLPREDLIKLLHDSKIYCHLMEGEHFGIAPIEALASGCVTLVHDSGGSGEFIPKEFLWKTFEELKEKIIQSGDLSFQNDVWQRKREELWEKISILEPKNFEQKIWDNVETLMQRT